MLGKKNPWSVMSSAIAGQILFVGHAESIELCTPPAGRPHDLTPDKRFLRDRAHARQLRLNLLEPLVNGGAEVTSPRTRRTGAG